MIHADYFIFRHFHTWKTKVKPVPYIQHYLCDFGGSLSSVTTSIALATWNLPPSWTWMLLGSCAQQAHQHLWQLNQVQICCSTKKARETWTGARAHTAFRLFPLKNKDHSKSLFCLSIYFGPPVKIIRIRCINNQKVICVLPFRNLYAKNNFFLTLTPHTLVKTATIRVKTRVPRQKHSIHVPASHSFWSWLNEIARFSERTNEK